MRTLGISNNILSYRFLDASVSPQYHRSYTISMMPEKIYFSVDSYGTLLSKKELALSKSAYQSFVTLLHELSTKNCNPTNPDGCTGGTCDRLLIITEDNNVKGHLYYCGGKNLVIWKEMLRQS